MRELYKRGSRLGTTASAVGVELKAMAKAGLVILRHDAVYCGVQESTASGGTSEATNSGGTSNSEAVAPIGTSVAQPNSSPSEEPGTDHMDEEARRSEVRRVLAELFIQRQPERDGEPPLTKATDPVTDIDRRDHSGAEGARRRRVHNVSGRGGSSGWTRGTQD